MQFSKDIRLNHLQLLIRTFFLSQENSTETKNQQKQEFIHFFFQNRFYVCSFVFTRLQKKSVIKLNDAFISFLFDNMNAFE
jgi:hypothetical protein